MRYYFLIIILFGFSNSHAQELFTYTEPASNMPAKNIGLRLTSTVMHDKEEASNNIHLFPELMVAVSKKMMFHFDGFASNRNGKYVTEGGSVYGKYRFYSEDEVHEHFRAAVYGTLAFNRSDLHQEAIDLRGHNSGYELGLVFTKLKHKVAVSANVSWLHATDNKNQIGYKFDYTGRDAMGFALSVGKLFLPKEYVTYKQTNLNMMVEMLGQTNLSTGRTFVDMAPVIQLVFLSRMRADFGYRFALSDALKRTASNGVLIRFEYNIFNAF